MLTTLLINSIVCVVGSIVGLLFAGGSIVSIANMTVPRVGWLHAAAIMVPIMFMVSGIGAWLAYTWGSTQLVIGLIALPWLYGVVFVFLMLVSFK
jgi:ABC-type multidrug transport system permease subunit